MNRRAAEEANEGRTENERKKNTHIKLSGNVATWRSHRSSAISKNTANAEGEKR